MTGMSNLYDEKRWELFPIAGDEFDLSDVHEATGPRAPDGLPYFGDGGIVSANMGIKQNCIAVVEVRYKDKILFIDVYRFGDELALHLICPRCLNYLWCSSTKKQMEFDLKTKKLSVEAMGCTWEEGRGTDGTHADRMDFGVGLCRWQIGISNNVAKDA